MASLDNTAPEEPRVSANTAPLDSMADGAESDGQVNERDRDVAMAVPRTGTNGTTVATQRPYAYTRNSSGFSSFLNYASSPTAERARPATPAYSATRSTVSERAVLASNGEAQVAAASTPLENASAESPNVSGSPPKASPPALAKLEIPGGPTVSLTRPTPEATKPRPKGQGTLELERVLGLWASKTPNSSFPSFGSLSTVTVSSPLSASTPTSGLPLFGQNIVSSEPESFIPVTSTAPGTSSSLGNDVSNPSGRTNRGDTLRIPAFPPQRRRSKSDTEIMRLDSLGFPHSNLPVGVYVDPPPVVTDGPTFAAHVAPPTPIDQQFAMNPTDTWRSPPRATAGSTSLAADPLSALDLDSSKPGESSAARLARLASSNQRELTPRSYLASALLNVPEQGSRGRRARSQGAGHRPSKSDDFSHLLPSILPQASGSTAADGLLALPQPPQETTPTPSGASPIPPKEAGSPFLAQQSLPTSAPEYASQNGSPFAPSQSPYAQAHPSLPVPPVSSAYPQPYPQPGPDQGYLANQAALLASAALIAFNPTDPAHAAAAAAGYLPPPPPQYAQYPSPYTNMPYGAYGAATAHSPGLPPLPLHHQPQASTSAYPPRPMSHAARMASSASASSRDPSPGGTSAYLAATAGQQASVGNGTSGPTARTHPSYVYHTPLSHHQLPSPPPSGKMTTAHDGLTAAGPRGGNARSLGRRRPSRTVVKREGDEDDGDDRMMIDRDDDDEGEGEQDDREDEEDEDEEDEEEADGSSLKRARGKGRKGGATKGRAKRQVSDDGFSERSKTTQATIDAAKRRRNANAVAKFVCELCGETFTRRYNLRGHQRAHNGEKPYKCSYEGCDKAFARAHDCKRHELLHLGVRKYHCSPCKRDFVRLDALHRHHRSEVGQACVKQLEAEGYVFDEKGAAVAL
ncbi:uncharacterized protein JCM15063_003123 [Sporobolomyces koalae]|uniref:uncharacterized protein n=1 Tax=Sporobolomyces koalae TaxID=500713 RepID=UPI00317A37CF